MPGQFYARWVPPKSVTRQGAAARPQQTAPPYDSSPQRPKKQQGSSASSPPQSDLTGVGNDGEKKASEDTCKSPKPAKMSKRKRESNVDERDEATPKKHKAILSKFEKVARRAEAREAPVAVEGAEGEQEERPEQVLRDLEPLPQPAPVPDAIYEPTFSVLPTWLAQPVTVAASKRVPFNELGVHPFFLRKLEQQGFHEALAVQSALLPMLHPGYEQHLGDICVSAKTGSGKTLAYLLPIIEALKNRVTPVLSAIIVVPSRQLVDQALRLAEEMCAGTKVKVGAAVGSVPFATEQKQLIKKRAQYDPRRAHELHERAARQLESGFVENPGLMHDLMSMPVDHVPQYESRVDILVCTPGRLVEHIESTTGFLLRSVRWLVIDEADQLLNQNFQGWSAVLMDALHGETPTDFMDAQECLQAKRQASAWGSILPARRQVTKVVLSATMEKDLTKLGTLRLKRPRLVTVQEEPGDEQLAMIDGDIFELPFALEESAVPVGDGQQKPLYLLYLLLNYAFKNGEDQQDASDEDQRARTIAKHGSRVLVFTKSNESASRLSHLLSVLEPSLKDHLQTMTPSSTAKAAKKLLRSFSKGTIKILIASDAASRGLDVPDITHVVNYDMPTSITSYVHRVGRTARAGKAGEAWTLFTKTEAAWFWKQVARGEGIRRVGRVKRVEWTKWNVTYNRKRTYEAALAELQDAVEGAEGAE